MNKRNISADFETILNKLYYEKETKVQLGAGAVKLKWCDKAGENDRESI